MAADVQLSRRTALRGMAAFAAMNCLRAPAAFAQTPEATTADQSDANGVAAFSDPEASAEELAQAWFNLLILASGEDAAGSGSSDPAAALAIMQPYLDPAFQLQRASGVRYVATDYAPATVEAYTIQDVRETRPADNLIVARYAVQASESTLGGTNVVLSDVLAPRLSVFRWDDAAAMWLMVSHANFNIPVATICEKEPLQPALNPMVPTTHDDVALGVSLVEAAAAAAVAGDTLPVLDPQVQVQTAAGYGYTTTAERPGETKLKPNVRHDYLITRHDDVIVASYRSAPSGEVNAVEVASEESPRMITFRLNEEGEWKAIATAYFSTVASVPDGVDCTPA